MRCGPSLLLVLIARVAAFEGWETYYPNTNNLDWEAAGHVDPHGHEEPNMFGLDAMRAGVGHTYDAWHTVVPRFGKTLCMSDSDGDGYSNGQELGDPCCVWKLGDVPTSAVVHHPGLVNDVPTLPPQDCTGITPLMFAGPTADYALIPTIYFGVSVCLLVVAGMLMTHAGGVRRGAVGSTCLRRRLTHHRDPLALLRNGCGRELGALDKLVKNQRFHDAIRFFDVLGLRDFLFEAVSMTVGELVFLTWLISFMFVIIGAYTAQYTALYEVHALGKSAGHVAVWGYTLVLVPIPRTNIIRHVCGMSFERAAKYHRIIGRVTALAAFAHGFFQYQSHYWLFSMESIDTGRGTVGPNLYGFLAVLAQLLQLLLTTELIRRKAYEVFYYLHFLFVPIYVFGALHSPGMWMYIVGPAALYTADKVHRLFQSRMSAAKLVSCVTNAGVATLTIEKKGFRAEAGDYVFLNVPGASCFAWHPFTISSAPQEAKDRFTVHILASGGFSNALVNKAESLTSVHVEGPYGNPSIHHLQDYPVLVLVSGGIGVTPMFSVLKDLHHKISHGELQHIQKVHFIWACRGSDVIAPFKDALDKVARHPTFTVGVYDTLNCGQELQEESSSLSDTADTSEGPTKNPKASKDVGASIHGGRPDMQRLLLAVRTAHQEHCRTVGVLMCGPKPLLESTQANCLALGSKHLSFHYHTETFLF